MKLSTGSWDPYEINKVKIYLPKRVILGQFIQENFTKQTLLHERKYEIDFYLQIKWARYVLIDVYMCVCACVWDMCRCHLLYHLPCILADDLSISVVGPLPEFPAAVKRVSVCIASTACAF